MSDRRVGSKPAELGGITMSEDNQFRQYAEEALRWATESTTPEQEKRTLIECRARCSLLAVA